MIWEPEYSIWEPEFLIWEPKYFIWEPECLIWEPKYLIWKPEYLVKSCPQGASAWGFGCGENFPDKKVRPFHLSIISLGIWQNPDHRKLRSQGIFCCQSMLFIRWNQIPFRWSYIKYFYVQKVENSYFRSLITENTAPPVQNIRWVILI